MSKKIRKLYFVWQLEKEKAYLEEMALKGYKLINVSFGGYEFEEIEPRKLIYQFDFRMLHKKQEKEYLSFFDDWEYISRFGGWYYFVIDGEDKDPDYSIFGDNKSKLGIYRRVLLILAVTGFPLYYQLFIFYPYLDTSETTFPKFYFFFRIVVLVVTFLHILVVLKILTVYKKLNDSIVE